MERSYVTHAKKTHAHAAHAQKNAGYFRLCHALFRIHQRATCLLRIGNGGADGLGALVCSDARTHCSSNADSSSVAHSNADAYARTDADKRSDARANRYPAVSSHLTLTAAHP